MTGLDQLFSVDRVRRRGWGLMYLLWQGAAIAGVLELLLAAAPATRPAEARLSGEVFTPDDVPAAGAELILVPPGQEAWLRDGRFDRFDGGLEPAIASRCVVKADAQGRFAFEPGLKGYVVIALHDSGVAHVPTAELARTHRIDLEAWGRIEGTLLKGGTPAIGDLTEQRAYVAGGLGHDAWLQGASNMEYDWTPKPAGDSKFVVDRVVPGFISAHGGLAHLYCGDLWMKFAVRPGRTTRLTPQTHRAVIGRIAPRPGANLDFEALHRQVKLKREWKYPAFGIDPGGDGYYARWVAGVEALRKQVAGESYADPPQPDPSMVRFNPDGSFAIENLLPGRYELRVNYYPSPGNRDPDEDPGVAFANCRFDVPVTPEDERDRPTDLGRFRLYPAEPRNQTPAAAIQPPPTPIGKLSWGGEVDGLRAAVEFIAGDRPYARGELIGVRFWVENVSERPIRVAGDTGRDDPVEVADANEQRVPAWNEPWHEIQEPMDVELGPGGRAVLGEGYLDTRKNPAEGELSVFTRQPNGFDAYPGVYRVRYSLYLPKIRRTPGGFEVDARWPADWRGQLKTGWHELIVRPEDRGAATQPATRAGDLRRDGPAAGLRCQLRAIVAEWEPGRSQPFLMANLRNVGTRPVPVVADARRCELEVDGRAYRWAGITVVQSTDLPPGQESNEVPIELAANWRSQLGDRPLGLTPGPHAVRVIFTVPPADGGDGPPLRVVSNSILVRTGPDKLPLRPSTTTPDDFDWPDGSLLLDVNLRRADGQPIGRTALTVWRRATDQDRAKIEAKHLAAIGWDGASSRWNVCYWRDPQTNTIWIPSLPQFVEGPAALVADLKPGDYRIAAASWFGDPTPAGTSGVIHVDSKQKRNAVTIELSAGRSFTVRAVSARDGRPLDSALWALCWADGWPVGLTQHGASQWADEAGTCRYAALPPGQYRIHIYREAFHYGELRHQTPAGGLSFEVKPDGSNDVSISVPGFEIGPEEARHRWSHTIEGRVTDPAGEPLAGVDVVVSTGVATLYPAGRAVSGSDGWYALRFGGQGVAMIGVYKAGYIERSRSVQGTLHIAQEGAKQSDLPDSASETTIVAGTSFRLDFVMTAAATQPPQTKPRP